MIFSREKILYEDEDGATRHLAAPVPLKLVGSIQYSIQYRMSNNPKNARPLAVLDDDEGRPETAKGYAWETKFVRSWDQIVEDPTTGRLKSFEIEKQVARKRRHDDGVRNVRRGMIRYCVLAIDLSIGMEGTDLKPSRVEVAESACQDFVREYFDQNPISQMSTIATRDSQARRLSSLSSSMALHTDGIQLGVKLGPYGDASLQNLLEMARRILAPIPDYGSREVVIVYGSLSTCDPGNIHETIASMVKEKIRCSSVGLGAELYILRVLAEKTGGTYRVAMNESHLAELLSAHIVPPPTTFKRMGASLIRMGFPVLKALEKPAICYDTLEIKSRCYECPRCEARISDVPSECVLCGLSLVSSPHLARSYHHLFPAIKYIQLEPGSPEALCNFLRCRSCLKALPKDQNLRLKCPKCQNIFCLDCDNFIHDVLHNCVGCENAGLRGDYSVLAGG